MVEIDLASLEIRRVIPLAFDPGPDTESGGRGVPNALHAPVVSPDGRQLWAPSKKDNIARGLQLDGLPHTFDTTVRAIVSVVDLSSGAELLDRRLDFNNRDMAVAVRFSPWGDFAFVALQGSNAIDVIDAYTGRFVTSIETWGAHPRAWSSPATAASSLCTAG